MRNDRPSRLHARAAEADEQPMISIPNATADGRATSEPSTQPRNGTTPDDPNRTAKIRGRSKRPKGREPIAMTINGHQWSVLAGVKPSHLSGVMAVLPNEGLILWDSEADRRELADLLLITIEKSIGRRTTA